MSSRMMQEHEDRVLDSMSAPVHKIARAGHSTLSG